MRRTLAPYGRWVEVKEYGRCWVPNRRPSGWRPYTVGHWANTSEGWCWNSEDDEQEWGTITYHYGRWYEDRSNGWIWVPGTTWAPAWVSWREGGGYAGWAPLPPTVVVRDRVDAVYVDRYVPSDRYVFVEERYMGERRVYDHVQRNNVTIVNKTTNITNITVVNNRVVNRGVSVTNIERSSGRKYEEVNVQRVTSESDARKYRSEGRVVAYEPESVKKADVEYRQRVERRADEAAAAEHDRGARRDVDNAEAKARANRRADDAAAAEHDRGSRRDVDNAAEKARANARADEAAAAEHDRGSRRDQDNAAEKARANARANDAAAAEKARANQRVADDAKAEHDRAARRVADDAAAKNAEKARVERRDMDAKAAATDKQAEHDRAVRREQEAAAAKEKAPRDAKQVESDKQAEHERAVRRAADEGKGGGKEPARDSKDSNGPK